MPEMHLRQSGFIKSVFAERFSRTLIAKIYKQMPAVSKNVYIDRVDEIHHRAIKMKLTDIKVDTYIDYGEHNNNGSRFKVGDHVKISKYQNIFVKGHTPNWSQDVFVIKKVKDTALQTYIFGDLNNKDIFRLINENELQKTNNN